MSGNDFLDKLEWIDPALIEAAETAPKQGRPAWLKWGGLAACLCVVAASVYALTASRQGPVEPPPVPDPDPAVTAPVDIDRPQELTSDVYGSLAELLEDLQSHDNHGQSDLKGLEGRGDGYSSAHAATEGSATVRCGDTVYQCMEGGGIGVYQNGVRTGTVDVLGEKLFVSGGRLVAVGKEHYGGDGVNPAYRVRVSVFDLSDPTKPQKLDDFTQLGNLTACWMAGTQLYLLTDDGVCACGYSRLSDLDDYKPRLFHGAAQIPWTEEEISILGEPSRVSYVAAVRIDTEDMEVLGKHAYYGDVGDVFYGQDWLALITQTTTENAHTIQDVYTFSASLNFTGRVDLAAAFGLEKTLAWSESQPPPREFYYPEIKAVDCAGGIWRMLGEYNHSIGPDWYRELFALTYDPAGGRPTKQTLQLPEAQFDIDDVVWEADRAIISAGYVQWDPYETGTRLAFARFDGTDVTLLSSDILCDRVTGIDKIYSYGAPLGNIRPFIVLGNGLYLRYNGTPDGLDLYDLSDSSAPKCLYRAQGAIADLPEGGRLDFDHQVLDEGTVAVKCIIPGPDGSYFRDAETCWVLIQVRPGEEVPVTLAESPRYPVTGVDPAALG